MMCGSGMSDGQLRDIIVNQQPGWQEAYRQLLVKRYGHIVKSVVGRFNPRDLGISEQEDFHGELLLYLRGQDGLWKYLRSWDPSRPFDRWLYVVVLNLCRNLVKGGQIFDPRPVSLDQPIVTAEGEEIPWKERLVNPYPDPEKTLLTDEEIKCLTECLLRLDNRKQVILHSFYWEKLTTTEIGQILGLTRETISRLKTAAERELLACVNDCLNR